MLMPGSLCQSSSCPLLQRLISELNEEADTKHEEGPLSMPALHLPKAVQCWLLPRKQRLGVVVTQSQANPPLPQMESDWGFSSCYLCLHRCEVCLTKALGQFLQGMEGATVIYLLEGAIAVLAAELPWRSASVFHKDKGKTVRKG